MLFVGKVHDHSFSVVRLHHRLEDIGKKGYPVLYLDIDNDVLESSRMFGPEDNFARKC